MTREDLLITISKLKNFNEELTERLKDATLKECMIMTLIERAGILNCDISINELKDVKSKYILHLSVDARNKDNKQIKLELKEK